MVEIIVQLKEYKDQYVKTLEQYMEIDHTSPIAKMVIGETTEQNIPIIKTLPFVKKVSYNILYKTQSSYTATEKPVDYITQEGMFITNWEANQFHNPPEDLTGKGIKIAVLDTGVNANHPLLKGKIIKNIQIAKGDIYDPIGHGSWIAGTLVARPKQTSVGLIKGVVPDARIVNIKVLDDKGIGTTSNIIKGLDKAVEEKCQIANLSLASPLPDPILNDAINEYAKHIVICCAGGNFGNDATVGCPASNPNTIAVGSIYPYNGQLKLSSFSPKGVDIVAVGGEVNPPVYILSTVFNTIKGECGTSISTPFVTGAIAQLLQAHPHLTPQDVIAIIRNLPYVNQYLGHGILDTKKLLEQSTKPIQQQTQLNPIPLFLLLALLLV